MESGEQDHIGQGHDGSTMNATQHIAVASFGEHPQAEHGNAAGAFLFPGEHRAQNLLVETRIVCRTPPVPAGVGWIRCKNERGAIFFHDGNTVDSPSIHKTERMDQTRRSAVIFLISAIARAGDRPFGQTFAQFMMVWQR